jgi:amidase
VDTVVGRSAADIARAVRIGEVSARDVVAAHLDCIGRLDPAVRAFRVVRRHEALREAEAVDVRPDRYALPLAGVPIAISDNTAVGGQAVLQGSLATSRQAADRDDEVVRRLRRAGAVVVGLTRVPELCVFPTTDDPETITRNPWDLGRSAGGSSGGSAAAVASGMVPVAHGTDAFGSVRIPASCCGVVGLKPGAGVMPAHDQRYGLSEHGVLAGSTGDAELVLAVLAGRREGDFRVELTERLRVAVSRRSPVAGVRPDADSREALARAARILVSRGHDAEIAGPPFSGSLGAAVVSHWAAWAAALTEGLDASLLQARTARHAAFGRQAVEQGRVRAGDRSAWTATVEELFGRYDVLLTPALAGPPPPAVRWSERSWVANISGSARFAPYSAPWSFAGVPAMTVPTGVRADGLPAGVQIVAGKGGEGLILAVARVIEAEVGRLIMRTA